VPVQNGIKAGFSIPLHGRRRHQAGAQHDCVDYEIAQSRMPPLYQRLRDFDNRREEYEDGGQQPAFSTLIFAIRQPYRSMLICGQTPVRCVNLCGLDALSHDGGQEW